MHFTSHLRAYTFLIAGPTYALSDHEGWTDQIARVRVSLVILEVEPGGIVSCGDYCLMFHSEILRLLVGHWPYVAWEASGFTAVLDTLLAPGITTRSTAFPLNHSASPYLIVLTVLRVTRLHLFSGESGNYNNHNEFMPWIVESPKFRFYLDFDWKIFIDIYADNRLLYIKSPWTDGGWH